MTAIAAPTASSEVRHNDLIAIRNSAIAAGNNAAASSSSPASSLGSAGSDSLNLGNGSYSNRIANFSRAGSTGSAASTGSNVATGPVNQTVASQAAASHNKLAGARRCFDVCNDFYQAMGGSNLTSTSGDKSLRGQGLDAMKGLPAGTVIYMSRNPGTDPSSTNLANEPHWMISLGGGQYADNVSPNMSHAEMISKYASRKIDETFPPPPKAANSSIA